MGIAVVATLAVVAAPGYADRKALDKYAGQIVVSPDAPPPGIDELPGFLATYAAKDGRYDLIKGPPWPMHLVAVLARDPGAQPVTLVFADKADKKLEPIHSITVSSKRRIVLARTEATIAAGFESGKTYVLRIMLGKTVLARAELTLRG